MISNKEWTLGETRYLTYELHFQDGELWRRQTAFWGPLSTWLRLTRLKSHTCVDLLRRGESRWKDPMGVLHKISIDTRKLEERWGRTPVKVVQELDE